MGGRVSWSDLPEDLLTKIGRCLDARFDMIRFRSVCRTWRYSLPLSLKNWNFQLPLSTYEESLRIQPIIYIESRGDGSFQHTEDVLRITVCILNQYPISTPWLLKLEETKQGKLYITNPITDKPLKDLPTTFPNVLNLLDYSILEISRGYINKNYSKCKGEEHFTFLSKSKVAILPESHMISAEDDDFVFLNLYVAGRLLLGRKGEKLLTQISKDGFQYDDIAVYRGRFVAIDRRGIVSFVDSSSSELIQLTPPILNGGHMKHLVGSSDHLYAVDRYFDRPLEDLHRDLIMDANVVSFKVYKLDDDSGWTEITSLDDRILFIGEEFNFFVPVKELSGCRGNYIYFSEEKYHYFEFAGISTGPGIVVFDMVDQRVGELSSFPGCSDMLWPPPSWFTDPDFTSKSNYVWLKVNLSSKVYTANPSLPWYLVFMYILRDT